MLYDHIHKRLTYIKINNSRLLVSSNPASSQGGLDCGILWRGLYSYYYVSVQIKIIQVAQSVKFDLIFPVL